MIASSSLRGRRGTTSLFAARVALLVGLAVVSGLTQERVARGTFEIRLEGQKIGVETYEIQYRETEIEVHSRVELSIGGQQLKQTTTLTLSPSYQLRRYEWQQQEPKKTFARVRFDGTTATMEFPLTADELDQREFIFETADLVVLDNNVFHHYLFLLRLYDFTRGGPQPIRILIPQEVLPALVTLEDRGEKTEMGSRFRWLVMTSENNEVWLWLDENRKLVRLSVPQAKVEVVRREP